MSIATEEEKLMSTVYAAIQTLHGDSKPEEKPVASQWLVQLQKQVDAWRVADQLLHQKASLHACYFAAQTLRTKIQTSFTELPVEAHISLRDSLLSHIQAIAPSTEIIIVRQLCLAVADLMLQMTVWADPISQLLTVLSNDPKHWWPLLEILRLIPEEVHSRTLQLGENRRNQVMNILVGSSQIVLDFLKRALGALLQGFVTQDTVPVEQCVIEIINCFGTWVSLNPELFCGTELNGHHNNIVMYALSQLNDLKCSLPMHRAATECLCGIIEILPTLDSSGNNNGVELETFQTYLFTHLMNLEEAYRYSVAEEELEKTLNYCRVFTEYSVSMVPRMLQSHTNPHYSTRSIDKVLMTVGHHDYEVAEVSYEFWCRFSEDLYSARNDNLNSMFREHINQLVYSLYNHCKIEPDHEGQLSDEFYHFRKQTAELIQDYIFVVGGGEIFGWLKKQYIEAVAWEDQEAALFLMQHTTSNIHPANTQLVWPVLQKIFDTQSWLHPLLKVAAIKLVGSLPRWISNNSDISLQKSLQFLVPELSNAQTSSKAAAAIENVCASCGEIIAAKLMNEMLGVVAHVNDCNISNEASVGLYRGLGHVISHLPCDDLEAVLRNVCQGPLQQLMRLLQEQSVNDRTYRPGSLQDPIHWIDRLGAVFRTIEVPKKVLQVAAKHPCRAAICEDFWPVISKAFEKHQSDIRVMERCSRSLRFAIRCIGKESIAFLQPLVVLLVSLYTSHAHSCFLYVTSVLVDEFGDEAQCTEGLVSTLQAFVAPTFHILTQPDGLVNNPDTVDDFFRLCTRYIQRCPIPFLKSQMFTTILECAAQASQLSHREANSTVLKYLYDIAHCGLRQKERPDFAERQTLVLAVMMNHGENLVSTMINAVLFTLPTYTYSDVCEFLIELKDLMPAEFSHWLQIALKKLPEKTASGKQAATMDQLHEFHRKSLNVKSSKELNRLVRDFSRLYR